MPADVMDWIDIIIILNFHSTTSFIEDGDEIEKRDWRSFSLLLL